MAGNPSESMQAQARRDGPDPRRWLMLPVVLLAMFMAGFDIWVVNVAAPSLQRDLHVSDAALQLIVGGYAFMYASGMVTGGRLVGRHHGSGLRSAGLGDGALEADARPGSAALHLLGSALARGQPLPPPAVRSGLLGGLVPERSRWC